MFPLRWTFAAVAIVLVAAPLLARPPLFDPDEGLHAAIAQEMNRRGDYVTPTFLGEPFLDKPILFFWAEAISLRVLGDREDAVRLPPLLFGVLAMLGVAALGRALRDEETGLLAGIVYGTMLLPMGVSEVAVHDVAVVPFMCAACAWLTRASAGRHVVRHAVLAGAALGLSILTKGLVGVAFAVWFAVALAAVERVRMRRLAIALTAAGAVALLVALPWYVAMEHAHPGYLHYYFVERHLQGYLTATQRHAGRGWWYYVPIAVGGALPWVGYLAAAARQVRNHPTRLVAWIWFALGFVFLSGGESKLVTYALPLFPALALLVADACVAGPGLRYRPGFVVCASTLAALPVLGLGLVAWRFGGIGATLWLMVALVAAVIGGVSVAIANRRSAGLAADAALMMRLPVVALLGLMIVAPRAAEWMTGRDLAQALNAAGAMPSQVFVVGERIGSVVFYLSPALRAEATAANIRETTLAEAVAGVRAAQPDAVVAVRNDQIGRFNRLFAAPPPPDVRAGTFSLFRAGSLQQALSAR